MRTLTRNVLRYGGILLMIAGAALIWGCTSDGRIFGFNTDASGKKKFSTTQAAADTQDPNVKNQAGILGPYGPIGLELAGVALYAISHLNKRVDSNTLKHVISTAGPAIVDGLIKAIPEDPAKPAAPSTGPPIAATAVTTNKT